ncbi:serine/threonine-protein kinase [Dactylosporangium sp. NPDC000521]|uniref:serine/threonine-protein kinase n=1 Tax=Dactylosporangium sp. NPDC000521 TaxID=3363975 RepID=UPI0036B9FB0D
MERYRLIEQLGVGGMSVVWRAHDEVLGRTVAIKQLVAAADPRSRRRIQDEARAAALLSHPHIAAVYDFGHDADGAPFVVMELVEGESLESRLVRTGGPLEVTESLRIAGQLASALAAVHERGLVHHDVKPANVMLTARGPKLVDFGVSAIAGNEPDQLIGTPAYLAPERIRGVPPSPATDVYALGLVLYRMLTGTLPWPATTTEELLHAHRKLPPAPLPTSVALPAGVADALRRCLAKAPGNRPAATDLASLLSNPPATRRLGPRHLFTTRHAAPALRLRDVTLGGSGRRRVSVAVAAALLFGSGAVGAAAQDRDPSPAWTGGSSSVADASPQPSDPAAPTTDTAAPATDPAVVPAGGATAGAAAGGGGGSGAGAVGSQGGANKGKAKGKNNGNGKGNGNAKKSSG